MSQPAENTLRLQDFLGVNQFNHPLTLDARQATVLENAEFLTKGVLKRRLGVDKYTTPVGNTTDGILGLCRFNNSGLRETLTVQTHTTASGTKVGVVWRVEENKILLIDQIGARASISSVSGKTVTLSNTTLDGDGGPSAGWGFAETDNNGDLVSEIYVIESVDSDTQITLDITGFAKVGANFRIFRLLSATAPCFFTMATHRLIMTNGVNQPTEFYANSGVIKAQALGVETPTNIGVSFADTGGTVVDGTYYFRIEYVSPIGSVSNPYPPATDYTSSDVVCTGGAPANENTITVTWDAVRNDNLESVDIYWAQDSGEAAGSSVNGIPTSFKYVATVDSDVGTYTITTPYNPNESVGADDYTHDVPPIATVSASFNGRVFYANTTLYQNWVYFSTDEFGEYVDSLNYIVLPGNDEITGMITYRNRLLVFMTNSVHELIPDSSGGYFPRQLIHNVGCVATRTLEADESTVFFLSRTGVHVFDGVRFTDIGEEVIEEIRDIIPTAREKACSCVGVDGYYLGIAKNATKNNTILHLNTRVGAWSVWKNIYSADSVATSTLTPAVMACFDGPGDSDEIVWGSNAENWLMEYGSDTLDRGHDDEQYNVIFQWKSGELEPGVSNYELDYKFLHVKVDTASKVTAIFETDHEESFEYTWTPPQPGSEWGSLWNVFWEEGTCIITETGSQFYAEFSTPLPADVNTGDKISFDEGVTTYEITRIGGASNFALINAFPGPTDADPRTFWIYRYEEPTGLWWGTSGDSASDLIVDLPDNMKGERMKITVTEDGEGADLTFSQVSVKFDTLEALPKGDAVD